MTDRLQQHWESYTPDDHEVWNILFERQVANLQDKAWSRYLQCIDLVGLSHSSVPRFSDIDNRLLALTGWSIEVVKGIIPIDQFIRLMHAKRFCSSTWLRKRHQLDYLEEPDMFHDIFGHTPLLADSAYAAFVSEYASLGMKYIDDPVALKLLGRIYWFTIEFGLMRENGEPRIYGAGILSSFGESKRVFMDGVKLRPFNIHEILLTPYRTDQMQPFYFVVDEMNSLWNCLSVADGFLSDVQKGHVQETSLRLDDEVSEMA